MSEHTINSFDDLLEACKGLLEVIDDLPEATLRMELNDNSYIEKLRFACAAIANAEK